MSDWEKSGIRIVRAGELDSNTPQTPGMHRKQRLLTLLPVLSSSAPAPLSLSPMQKPERIIMAN